MQDAVVNRALGNIKDYIIDSVSKLEDPDLRVNIYRVYGISNGVREAYRFARREEHFPVNIAKWFALGAAWYSGEGTLEVRTYERNRGAAN